MAPDSTPHDEIRRFQEQYRSQPESLVFARLADAYRKAGEAEQALEVLTDGLQRHPDYATGHIVRARTLRDLGRLDDAALSFRTVLELDAGNLVAMSELGSLAEERGELTEARHWYESLVHVDPTNTDAFDRLAELQEAIDDLPEHPPEVPVVEPATDVPGEQSDGSEWWNDPVQASSADPDTDGDDIALEGDEVVAAILNGDVPRTIRAEDTWWYEERPETEPPEPSAEADLLTRTMADLYAEQGLYDEAAEIYEELLRDSPEDAGLQSRLFELREKATRRQSELETDAPAEPAAEEPLAASEATPDVDAFPHIEPEATVSDAVLQVPTRPSGPPVGEEIRRILRMGEEAAAQLSEPEPVEPASHPEAAEDVAEAEAASSDLSGFARDWLADLESRG